MSILLLAGRSAVLVSCGYGELLADLPLQAGQGARGRRAC